MLPEISLNVLDIAQNSISANATEIQIRLKRDTKENRLEVLIQDNGKGMSEEMVQFVIDPFFTTRKTRKVGLGIPFFKEAAECTGGLFQIHSVEGVGTEVKAVFCTDHIDCMPVGDMNETIHTLVVFNEHIRFLYEYIVDDKSFCLDTDQIRQIVGDVSFQEPEIAGFLKAYLTENEAEVDRMVE